MKKKNVRHGSAVAAALLLGAAAALGAGVTKVERVSVSAAGEQGNSHPGRVCREEEPPEWRKTSWHRSRTMGAGGRVRVPIADSWARISQLAVPR